MIDDAGCRRAEQVIDAAVAVRPDDDEIDLLDRREIADDLPGSPESRLDAFDKLRRHDLDVLLHKLALSSTAFSATWAGVSRSISGGRSGVRPTARMMRSFASPWEASVVAVRST